MGKRRIVIIAVLLVIIFLETFLLMHLRAELIEKAPQLGAIQEEILRWEGENSVLYEEKLRRQSFTEIAERAEAQGFVPAQAHLWEP